MPRHHFRRVRPAPESRARPRGLVGPRSQGHACLVGARVGAPMGATRVIVRPDRWRRSSECRGDRTGCECPRVRALDGSKDVSSARTRTSAPFFMFPPLNEMNGGEGGITPRNHVMSRDVGGAGRRCPSPTKIKPKHPGGRIMDPNLEFGQITRHSRATHTGDQPRHGGLFAGRLRTGMSEKSPPSTTHGGRRRWHQRRWAPACGTRRRP